MSVSLSPDKHDINWVLAYAILDSLSEDLRLRRKQRFWQTHPDEMRGKTAYPINEIPQPADLLKEINSAWVSCLCSLIFYETQGRVRIGVSDLIRRARA